RLPSDCRKRVKREPRSRPSESRASPRRKRSDLAWNRGLGRALASLLRDGWRGWAVPAALWCDLGPAGSMPKEDEQPIMSPNATPFPTALRKPRILFVEDEATLRDHLAAVLSDQYIVDTAGNGIEALKAVIRRKPDLIITDIVMPEMDGVELLKILRGEPATQ